MSLHTLVRRTANIISLLFIFIPMIIMAAETENNNVPELKINKIIIVRKNKNNYLTDELIKNSIPYKQGEIFKANKTNALIHNLYNLGKPFSFFNQVQVMGKLLEDNLMNLYVITHEKKELINVIIKGNKKVDEKELNEKFKFEDIHAINEIDLQKIVNGIKKLYRDKDFHLIEIDSELKTEDNKATAIINIKENKKSLVKRVFFKGNCNINSKRLRSIIFTREDWLFGFVNKAGSYRQEHVDQDKYMIENYYKSHGYLMAKVTSVDVKMDPINKQYYVTFEIEEGDLYTIKDVKVVGNEILSESTLIDSISIKPGDLYSVKEIRDSIETIKSLWGECGYVFADVDPVIIPDEKSKTVSIIFNSELGDKVFVNRINILGNRKTKEHVIRRKLSVEEGDLLTTTAMDASKDRVANLGFFDPQNGVNWKINRLSDEAADLDLMLNEIKTGRMAANIGVGGSPTNIQSTSQGFRAGASIHDTNLFGEGILLKASGEWSPEEWTVAFNLVNPWSFGRPIYTEGDFYITKSSYTDELKNTNEFRERIIGAFFGSGFTTSYKSLLQDLGVMFKIGIEDIRQSSKPKAVGLTEDVAEIYQIILNRRFKSGSILSLNNRIAQDTRNHTLHPSRGYLWSMAFKLGFSIDVDRENNRSEKDKESLPIFMAKKEKLDRRGMSYAKLEIEGSYYTPLIGENKLVFGLHGFFGIVGHLGNNIIPYRELFHIGGPASVRGFTYGQIGPNFLNDSIGATRAFFINTELIFPITKDFSIKGAVFYDGGAGWNTPDVKSISREHRHLIHNNDFEYRHAIGFGIRMLRPTPVKIDWGFKLDRKKGEKSSELHLSAYRDF